MSTVYVLEPPTKGKVMLTTSKGPIDIELWPKEAPKAVRNLVQLCREGITITPLFTALLNPFSFKEVIPPAPEKGLVACAGVPGTPNSNAIQFFVTLDRCGWLDKKHTIFGKVTGDSIYNLLQLGEVETDKNDRPEDPLPKILSAEVLWNPFDDIVPRVIPEKSSLPSEKKEPKQKATKKLNLLSFEEEAEEEIELAAAAANPRIKSSHDVLNDPRLLKDGLENDSNSTEGQRSRDTQLMVREALSKKEHKEEFGAANSDSPNHSDEDEAFFDARMRQQILKEDTI